MNIFLPWLTKHFFSDLLCSLAWELMDVSLNAGLTFSPPWLGPPQAAAIRTKRPNLLILHPPSYSSSSSPNTFTFKGVLLYLDCPKSILRTFFPPGFSFSSQQNRLHHYCLILCCQWHFGLPPIRPFSTSSMISMIILVMITSTAFNAFLNGSQRAVTQRRCENCKTFGGGEVTSTGVHFVVHKGLLRKEGVKKGEI